MFNVGSGEFLIILLVALVVLGPTRLPDALRQVGRVIGEAKKLSANFQNEVNEAMSDPVKKVTGEEMPKLPKVPRTSKELIGFAVPEPFAAQEKVEKPTLPDDDDIADDDIAEDDIAEDRSGVAQAMPARASMVEPAHIPSAVDADSATANFGAADDDAAAAAAADDDDEVPMFGDR